MTSSQCDLRVARVNADDVFNLPLYEYHLVIDTRTVVEYERGHIATAASLPAPERSSSDSEKERALVLFLAQLVEDGLQPEMVSPVLLYGDGSERAESYNEWLASRMAALKGDRPLEVATLGPRGPQLDHASSAEGVAQEYVPLVDLSDRLKKYTQQVGFVKEERSLLFSDQN